MGGIAPNIALMGQAPQLNDPLAEYQKGLQIKSLIGQQVLQQQQQQAAATEQQQRELQLGQQQQDAADRDAFNKSFHDAGGDWNKAIQSAPANGVSAQGLLKYQAARVDQVTKLAAMDKDLISNAQAKSDLDAKDAYRVQQTADPDARAALWTSLRNQRIADGTHKPNEVPEQVPDDQALQSIVSSNKATSDMAKEALALKEQNAKLPGEQADALSKVYSNTAQTMSGANDQLGWTAKRNMVVGNNPDMATLVPEQYSPQAAESVRQLGISPKDLAEMSPDKIEFQAFLKHPEPGYPATPIGYAKWKSDQTAQAQVRAVQMLQGGGGKTATPAPPAAGPTPQAPNSSPSQVGATPTQPGDPPNTNNAPGGWVSSVDGRSLNSVNPMVRARLKQILEYKAPDPPPGARGPVPQALANLIPEFDPNHDATTFPARNKVLGEYVKDMSGGQLGAVNTALGHLGELATAAQELDKNVPFSKANFPILHSLANKLGIAVGDDAASTYRAILHRVGPEMTAAYVKGGGTEGERGANESDFDISKGQQQIMSNIAESAQLLNSKIDTKRKNWQDTFRPYRPEDEFDNRFLTPAAKTVLQTLSSQAPTNKANQGAQGGPAKAPDGATHIGVSSKDGKKYYLDANGKKLGPAE